MAAAAVALVLVLAELGQRADDHVPRLTVTNPTEYTLALEVASSPGAPTLRLGSVPPHSERVFSQVLDRDGTWLFIPSYAREDLPPFETTREQLEASGWALEIPEDTVARLRAEGTAPTP